jgi:hypothetical protein
VKLYKPVPVKRTTKPINCNHENFCHAVMRKRQVRYRGGGEEGKNKGEHTLSIVRGAGIVNNDANHPNQDDTRGINKGSVNCRKTLGNRQTSKVEERNG